MLYTYVSDQYFSCLIITSLFMQIYLYLIYFCKHMRFHIIWIHSSLLFLRPPPPLPPPFHSSPPPVYINFHHFNHSDATYFWFTCKLYLIARFKVSCCTLFTAFTFNLRNLLHNYRLCAVSRRIICASTLEFTSTVSCASTLAVILSQQSVISSLSGWLKFVISWLLKS